MFIFLVYFLLNVELTFSTIVVQNSGLYEIKKGDIGMIFFLTVENTFDCKIPVSLYHVECEEGDTYSEISNYMYLLGGDMGYLERKHTQNLTLIYPNLYLRNRIGKCIVALRFQTNQIVEEVRKEIYFNSNKAFKTVQADNQQGSETSGSNDLEDVADIDCVIKYSSTRSYLNKEITLCQAVPECDPNTVYIPKSNICRKLHEPVCKADLEMLEEGYIEKCHSVSNVVNYFCHHGSTGNRTGECVCNEGWTSSTCSEGAYHPTLNLYHLCNIEFHTWESENREKLVMTVLVLVILSIALAAKMLLAVCLLNWCCHFIRSKKKNDTDDDYCGSYNCPYAYCGDTACEEKKLCNRSSKSIRVSFSNVGATSSAEDTDVTVTLDDDDQSESKSTGRTSKKSSRCHCTKI